MAELEYFETGTLKLAVKKLHFEKGDFEIYESDF